MYTNFTLAVAEKRSRPPFGGPASFGSLVDLAGIMATQSDLAGTLGSVLGEKLPERPQEGIRMLSYIRKVMRSASDRGASAVEYGLMVAAIAAVIVGLVFGLGGLVKKTFSTTSSAISNCQTAGVTC